MQLTMALATRVQTPLVLGKYPLEHNKQVKGATVVALTQFGKMLDTQDVMPLVVCKPNPGVQLPQAVIDVKVKQLVAVAATQLVEFNKNSPWLQDEQVKLATYTMQLVMTVDWMQELLLR